MSYVYGLKMDLSFSSYITILPAAVIPVLLFFKRSEKTIHRFLLFYTSCWIILLAIIYTIDAELFSFWGFRLDNTIFRYSGTFSEATESSFSSPLYILFSFCILYSYVFITAYKKIFGIIHFSDIRVIQIPVTLFSAALLVIPIRGGLQQVPLNESVSYYSTHAFLNQAALNPAWTLARSVIEHNSTKVDHYQFFSSAEVQKIILNHTDRTDSKIMSPLNTTRPNIVLIVWESLTSKVLNETVTPNLYSLLKDGIYFSNLYASGDRSDKGLVALLSAYPAQPDFSIMTEPAKSRKLPFITRQLKDAGYKTCYMYGGELEFANMRSYMNYNGFDEILGKKDFKNAPKGVWGAHDEATFKLLFDKLQVAATKKDPFFYTLFTLSSHEPYDIPSKPFFSGSSKTVQFQSSHHYTDSCFFDFIQKAHKQTWWKNTWVIVVADHGHVLPGSDYATHNPSEFKIPMLWLGGAIKNATTVKETRQQVSLAPSIAQYLKLRPEEFSFARPLNLKDTTEKISWYSYNDGFALAYNQTDFVQFDLTTDTPSAQNGFVKPDELTWGKAFLQLLMEDFYRK